MLASQHVTLGNLVLRKGLQGWQWHASSLSRAGLSFEESVAAADVCCASNAEGLNFGADPQQI